MKVQLKPATFTSGLISKTTCHAIHYTVTFSPEELKTIKEAGLGDYRFASFDAVFQNQPGWTWTVEDLVGCNGKEMGHAFFETRADADAFHGQFKSELTALKQAIEQYSKPSEAESFEL